jgi:[acyl-carrier-protein] S-malonyltransferase
MAPAREEMAKLFETEAVTPKTPAFPYVSNVDGKLVSDAAEILPKLLNQLNHAVRWQQSIELLLSEEPTVFVECGPGAVLQGLGKRIAKAEGAKRPIEARWLGVSDVESLKAFKGGTA